MGILGRINRVIKSNVNELLDRMSDPAKEVDLLINDMEEAEKKAKEELIAATATVKLTAQRSQELREKLDLWQGRAERAVLARDDDLARQALAEKGVVQVQLQEMERLSQEQQAYVEKLRSSLVQLQAKIKEIRARSGTLKERARASRQGRAGQTPGSQALRDFQQLEDRIEAFEAEGSLTDSLDGRDSATEAKFSKLEEQHDPAVEDALAELKRKLSEEGGS